MKSDLTFFHPIKIIAKWKYNQQKQTIFASISNFFMEVDSIFNNLTENEIKFCIFISAAFTWKWIYSTQKNK